MIKTSLTIFSNDLFIFEIFEIFKETFLIIFIKFTSKIT